MIELRWTIPEGTTTTQPVLQWRCRQQDPWEKWTMWGKWQDVPTTVIPAVPNAKLTGAATETENSS